MRMLMEVSFPVEPFSGMTPEDLRVSDLDRVPAKYRS